MKLINKFRAMFADESGAVTVDWVVLTAAVVVLSIGAIFALDGGISSLVTDINSELDFDSISSQADSN